MEILRFSSSYSYCVWISLITLTIFNNKVVADRNTFLKSKSSKAIHPIPSLKDLRVYLNSLERIINFSYIYKDVFDLSYSFGIFLVNVLSLFKNYTSWSNWIKKLNFELPCGRGFPSDLNKEYIDWRWKDYVIHVDDIDMWEPSPQQSDLCLASLAKTEENISIHSQKCYFPENCNRMLRNGTNFGYALTHRLLFLLFARFGRGCTILSKQQDRRLRRSFCNNIYTEAEYIAYNHYRHVDLMLEQITLCTLNGHAEFLCLPWLSNILKYQTPHGCFGQQLHSLRNERTKISEEVNWKHDVLNKTCNGHVTSLAAASTAAAVRFILEQY